ncbi:hypothetical protein EA187_18645 [Lujinxingia sediminis]|uniref:Big-1 domain-containing protein n=1 Tax=Lujinxingia sediminis TaxID=2480984 RepID=A0ABY0CNE9_9DELT|nr:hypothetical protein [Lujinxingia sediminis]RVU41491.1 hypothetical protein EA187_18645 [Lujinxingia sediminis]
MIRTSSWMPSLAALMLLLGAAACGESSVHYNTGDGVTRVDTNPDRDPPTNNDARGYMLSAVSQTDQGTYIGESLELQVRLASDQGEVTPDEAITFEIIAETGSTQTRLQSNSSFTNAQGIATNRLLVGDALGTIRVRATHSWADDPVDFTINVGTIPLGALRIGASYDRSDVAPLSFVQLRLWDAVQQPCSSIPTFTPPASAHLLEADLADLTDTALFEGLNPNDRYTVVAYGRGAFDQIMAFGCADEVSAEPDATTDVMVDLTLLDLMPTGVYDVESYWDFREAISSTGAIGSTLVSAIEIMSDPGDALAEEAVEWAQDWVCETQSIEACGAALLVGSEARSRLRNFINEQLERMSFTQNIIAIGQDLNDTISQMKVESVLTISNKQVGEGELRGVDAWQAMNFYWRRNCTDTSPADCGEIRFGLGSGSSIGALQSEWDGRLTNYNRLEIDAHEMTVPYGLVILQILNETIIPGLTNGNANSISGAVTYWICDNIGSVNIWGVSVNVGSFCSSLIAPVLGTYINQYLANLEFSINLFVEGEGLMFDTDSDGVTDLINEGLFLGEVRRDDGPPTEMEATFEGVRQP